MVHTTDHTQLRLPVRLQQSERWERPALQPLSGYSVPSDARGAGDLGPSRALRPKRTRSRSRAPHPTPSHAASCSRRRSDKLDRSPLRSPRRPSAQTAAGSGLPRGSARVVRQLGGMGTRSWSRRGRQMARREALRADAGNKERSSGEKEARAWRVPHWR